MGKLQTYILRQLVFSTVVATTVLGCVVWLTQSLRFVDMIVHSGLSLWAFLGFTLLLLPSLLMIIGPVGLFVGTLYTYHRMYNDRELVILQASGLSIGFMARPAILLALILTAFGYVNSLYLTPNAFRDFKDLQRLYRNELKSITIHEGVFNPVMPGVTLFVKERRFDGQLQDLVIHDERHLIDSKRHPEGPVTAMAAHGRIMADSKGIRVKLTNGSRLSFGGVSGKMVQFHFAEHEFTIRGDQKVRDKLDREPRERFLGDLFVPVEEAGTRLKQRRLRMEGIHRLSSPLLYLASTLVALGLLLTGSFSRSGHRFRVLVSVPVVLAAHILMFGSKYLGERIPQVEVLVYAFPLAFIAAFALMLSPLRVSRQGSAANALARSKGPA